MFLIVNIIAIPILIGIAYLFSMDKKAIDWRSVLTIVGLMLVLAWFFNKFTIGQDIIKGAASGFAWLIAVANQGIAFALPDWLTANHGGPNFVTSALLPILLVVPMFDILTYIGVLPWIIKWVGRGLSFITRQPKFEAFFSVEMMFLGNTEVLAVSKAQLNRMSAQRNLTLAMMSMSCVTTSVLGAYTKMIPGQYVLMAVPLNILASIVFTAILNPVQLDPSEDVIVNESTEEGHQREPFFSFLSNSILGAGKLILIITATVIAFVGLAALIDQLLGLTGFHWLTLEKIIGVVMFPFAWLLGFNPADAFNLSQLMGLKLVTNEFVVMGQISKSIMAGTGLFHNPHAVAVTAVFLTSFANFGTLGMIIGAFKGLTGKKVNDLISSQAGYLMLSGILVSLLAAATAGIFVW